MSTHETDNIRDPLLQDDHRNSL